MEQIDRIGLVIRNKQKEADEIAVGLRNVKRGDTAMSAVTKSLHKGGAVIS